MSKEVKRFSPDINGRMREWPDGDYVIWEDCEALLAEQNQPTQAAADVLAERMRQVTAKGWTPAHDDLYSAAELPRAAAAYILSGANDDAPCIWPFGSKWWKPRDGRANYVRAAALLLAEIERIDRAALQGEQP